MTSKGVDQDEIEGQGVIEEKVINDGAGMERMIVEGVVNNRGWKGRDD